MLSITTTADFSDISLPQELYASKRIADAETVDGEACGIYVGLNEKYAADLKAYSLDLTDKPLQDGTEDHTRFGTGDYEARYAQKKRTQIALVRSADDKMVSLLWYGAKSLPETADITDQSLTDIDPSMWDTISFRTYGEFRGKKVTSAFSAYVIDLYKKAHPERNLWLAVQKDNVPGIGLYTKLGFTTIGEDSKENELIMALRG